MTTDGLVVVDKPAGMTSHDVVGRCRRIFGQRRVGHAGTLDPDATGVLLVGLGRATRLMQYMSGLSKRYVGEIVLGSATSTLDSSGEVTGTWDMTSVPLEAARAAAAGLTGPILQVPPMVSAVKVGGRRLHQMARAGIEVERQPRPVVVESFELEWAAAGPPVLRAEIACSSGTYIRVLADDLGRALGGGAHLRNLRRTAIGPWHERVATPLDRVDSDAVVSPADALPWLPAVTADGQLATDVGHGRPFSADSPGFEGQPGPWRVLSADGRLLAVYESTGDGRVKPKVVLSGDDLG